MQVGIILQLELDAVEGHRQDASPLPRVIG